MSFDIRQPLLIVGCGDFGLSAVAHLHARGLGAQAGPGGAQTLPIRLLTVGGVARSRRQGQELFDRKLRSGWPEWDDSLSRHPRPLLLLIAAAGEAAGSGILTAALMHLAQSAPGIRTALWLALPSEEAEPDRRARAYALLQELDQLRASETWERCYLYEAGQAQQMLPAMCAEAALLYGQGIADSSPGEVGPYAGFGLGGVRELRPLLLEQLAPLAARQFVASWSHGGKTAQAPPASEATPPLSEARPTPSDAVIQHALTRLVTDHSPPDLTAKRWVSLAEYTRLRRHCMNPNETAAAFQKHLDQSLGAMYSYYAPGHWARWVENARRYFHLVAGEVRRSLAQALTELQRNRDEAAGASFAASLSDLKERLETGRTHREKARAEFQFAIDVTMDKLKAALDPPAPGPRQARTRRPDTAQREALARMVARLDEQLADRTLEECRVAAATWLLDRLQPMAEEVRALQEEFARRRERAHLLLPALEARAASLHVTTAPHILPPPIPADRLDALLPRVTPYHMLQAAQTGPADHLPRWQAQVEEAARRDVALLLESVSDLRLAVLKGSPAREEWLRLIWPHLRLEAPYGPEAVRIRISDRLPADYRAELAQRFGGQIRQMPVDWFPGEAFVWLETLRFADLRQLTLMSSLHEGFDRLEPGERAQLFLLAEPPQGWPDLRPPRRVARESGVAAAVLLARGLLLGLVTPAPRGKGLLARYLSPVGEAVLLRPFAGKAEAIDAITRDPGLADGLQHLTDRWLARLGMQQRAAYYALLFHTRHGGPDMDRPGMSGTGRDGPAVDDPWHAGLAYELDRVVRQLQAAGREWELLAGAMALVVGTAQDQFSLSMGDWRYLKW